MKARDVGRLTVKKRGVGVQPDALRRTLRPRGLAEATLVVTRVARRAAVLAVEPLGDQPGVGLISSRPVRPP